MPRTTRSKQGQSNDSSRNIISPLANVSNVLNRRNPTNGGSKLSEANKKRSTNRRSESENSDGDAAIDELGRRITRSMTLETTSKPENSRGGSSSAKHTTRRRARLAAPPNPSNMRVTRSMALRDKRLTANKISIDAIANIATYLQPNSEAMNVCLALGPKGAEIVKRRYLLHEKCNHWCQSSTEFLCSILYDGVTAERRCQMVYQWMLVNDKSRRWLMKRGSWFRVVPPLVSQKDETVTFFLVPIFSNPGLAAVLGITFLLELHFLRPGFDVNRLYNFEATASRTDVGIEENRAHLVTIAMQRNDVKTFDTLIAHPRIELSSPSKTFEEPRRNLFFYALMSRKSNKSHFLRTIATHRKFDINGPIRFSEEIIYTPLTWFISRYSNTRIFLTSPRRALEILIEAGADVHLNVENMRSPYDLALRCILNNDDDDDDELVRYLEALTVMREWPASMKINGLVRGFLARRRLATTHAAAQR